MCYNNFVFNNFPIKELRLKDKFSAKNCFFIYLFSAQPYYFLFHFSSAGGTKYGKGYEMGGEWSRT